MIEKSFDEVHSKKWVESNLRDCNHELFVVRQVVPWQKIIDQLVQYYAKDTGKFGINLRVVSALLLLGKLRGLGDQATIDLVQENRYAQYFCNVGDQELFWFIDRSTLVKFRRRIGVEGCQLIESLSFENLRKSGVIQNDASLIDSSVLAHNIIYPNDVDLLYKAFIKMKSWAKVREEPLWWDHAHLKKRWKDYSMGKKQQRLQFLLEFHTLLIKASKIFQKMVHKLEDSQQKKQENTGWMFLNC